MNEQLVKELISFKLKVCRNMIDLLPQSKGEKVKPFYEGLIKAVNAATGEYVGSDTTKNAGGKNNLKTITID